jgi:hypothetical protein
VLEGGGRSSKGDQGSTIVQTVDRWSVDRIERLESSFDAEIWSIGICELFDNDAKEVNKHCWDQIPWALSSLHAAWTLKPSMKG